MKRDFSWGTEYYNDKKQLHRENGPAITWYDNRESWFLNGVEYFPEEMTPKLYMEYLKWEYKKKKHDTV